MAKKKRSKSPPKKKTSKSPKSKRPSMAIAIIGLILNIFLMPGLGTLIGGKIKPGVWQLVLFWVGVLLVVIFIGIPMIIAAWIWDIVSGVRLIQEAS